MPGDNVEMVCSLVHDVAAEVGSRYVELLLFITANFSQVITASPYGKAGRRVSLLFVRTKPSNDALCSRDWHCH